MTLKPQLSLRDATLLVVASVVGSGIFFAPASVATLLPHPVWFLLAWLCGGLLSVAGACANAELGAMYPRAGGDYVYLKEAFHPLAGFLVGWFTFFSIFTGTLATLGVALAESLTVFFPLSDQGKLLGAIAFVALTSGINYIGLRWGTVLNNLGSYTKIAALCAFALCGPLFGQGSVEHWQISEETAESVSLPNFALALSPILFTYLGWNAPVYVAGEIRCAQRTLPASLFRGLGICTGLYLIVNGVYLYALSPQELGAQINTGATAAQALFGHEIGAVVGMFTFVSILGTLNATILVGPRIAYAMALDGLFFGGAQRVHARYGTPHRAILIQALVAVLLILAYGNFARVLDYTVFGILLATMADTLALFTLRRRKPGLSRPYRAWGYPTVPAVYLAANLMLAWMMLRERPQECAASLGLLALGLPFYLMFVSNQQRD
ncbi:MAG: APC family permease [Gammaproteobacteria bacterium]